MSILRRTLLSLLVGLALSPAPAFAQSLPADQDVRVSPADQQRLADLVSVVEGQNSPQARRTAARELLRLDWSESVRRLTAILSGTNRPARLAVALALSDLPQHLEDAYVSPLIAMFSDEDAEQRRAASSALAAYRDGGVIPRLRGLMLDPERSPTVRLTAVDTLGMMTQKEAIAALVEGLADVRSPVAKPALAALERATGQRFEDDIAAARAWWHTLREIPLEEWQRLQIERLVRQNRSTEQEAASLRSRLVGSLRENYLRTAEADRGAVLVAYLTDGSTVVRLLGLELVQAGVAEGRSLGPDIPARTRELLGASDPAVRAAAARVVASFREAADADRFLLMLAAERYTDVRQALINGLGYVGGTNTAAALLTALDENDTNTVGEAVSALGRLAERGVLDASATRAVGAKLLGLFRGSKREDASLRERLLWAMSRLNDTSLAAIFVEALDPAEAPSVRQAAARGIRVLADVEAARSNATGPISTAPVASTQPTVGREAMADALVPATSDPDAGVRRAAVDALAILASTDAHLQALWGRAVGALESDEVIRENSWRGVIRYLGGGRPEEIDNWLARLPDGSNGTDARRLELLQLSEKALLGGDSIDSRARVRDRIAAMRLRLGQHEEAVQAYVLCMQDLVAANSDDIPRVAGELLATSIRCGRYDDGVAAVLQSAGPSLDGAAVMGVLRKELRGLVDSDPGRAVVVLEALALNPPIPFENGTREEFEVLLREARRRQASDDTSNAKQPLGQLHSQSVDKFAFLGVVD